VWVKYPEPSFKCKAGICCTVAPGIKDEFSWLTVEVLQWPSRTPAFPRKGVFLPIVMVHAKSSGQNDFISWDGYFIQEIEILIFNPGTEAIRSPLARKRDVHVQEKEMCLHCPRNINDTKEAGVCTGY
jgi:hypothetical protein